MWHADPDKPADTCTSYDDYYYDERLLSLLR